MDLTQGPRPSPGCDRRHFVKEKTLGKGVTDEIV